MLFRSKAFTLIKASDDNNYTLENVAMSSLRPAVHGILKNAQGQRLIQVFGVHLKAMPDKADVRRQQIQMISDYIDAREDREPVLVVGDFNSYTTEDRDWSDIFGPDLKQVPITEPLTFNDGHYTGKFDRAWISTSLAGGVTEHVLGPCNSSSSAAVSA